MPTSVYQLAVIYVIKEAFDIPESWELRAQMPFGSIEAPAGEKEFLPDDVRFKVFE